MLCSNREIVYFRVLVSVDNFDIVAHLHISWYSYTRIKDILC